MLDIIRWFTFNNRKIINVNQEKLLLLKLIVLKPGFNALENLFCC